jgi:hypothetical protein
MAPARCVGPLPREAAAELPLWLSRQAGPFARTSTPIEGAFLEAGARLDAGTYTLPKVDAQALRGRSALVRMLDGGRRLLDVAVFMSLVKEFERSGS